jgi:two-component system, cell cycle response regulator
MTARILVVDDSLANAALLQAMLTSEYYEVVTAQDGPEAFARIAESQPDLVLLDAVMPGADGFEVCRLIKGSSEWTHLPVVIVTSLDAAENRITALQAGADEFLTKPLEPITLLAVVRSVVRDKRMIDELRTHARTGNDAGGEEVDDATVLAESADGSRVLVIADDRERSDDLRFALSAHHQVHVERDPDDALLLVRRAEFDLIVVDLTLSGTDGMRVCSRLRLLEETRRTPLLAVACDQGVEARALALDVGANGVISAPVHPVELLARVEACVRRKRYADRLRKNVRLSIERAVVDSLTSMHNRRYLQRHLGPLVAQNVERGRPVSLMIMDVDHFKSINDTYGHEVGDEVLREMARRIASGVRGLDLCCRFGGEEFVAAFAGVDAPTALRIAERLRGRIASDPFPISTERGPLTVTISVGVATTASREDTADLLLRRADLALYRAKKEGRNRVVVGA